MTAEYPPNGPAATLAFLLCRRKAWVLEDDWSLETVDNDVDDGCSGWKAFVMEREIVDMNNTLMIAVPTLSVKGKSTSDMKWTLTTLKSTLPLVW